MTIPECERVMNSMHPHLPAILIACLLTATIAPAPAHARIGETPAECARRYGPPLDATRTPAIHRKNGFTVGIVYHQGRACVLFLTAEPAPGRPSRPLDPREIDLLLAANAGGLTWTREPGPDQGAFWATADESRFARYGTEDHNLVITTADAAARDIEARRTRQAGNLQGF